MNIFEKIYILRGKFINFWSAAMREKAILIQSDKTIFFFFFLRHRLFIEEKGLASLSALLSLSLLFEIRLCVQYQKIKTAFPNFEAFDKIQSCPIKESLFASANRVQASWQREKERVRERTREKKDQPYPSRMRLGHWSKCKAKYISVIGTRLRQFQNCQSLILYIYKTFILYLFISFVA